MDKAQQYDKCTYNKNSTNKGTKNIGNCPQLTKEHLLYAHS